MSNVETLATNIDSIGGYSREELRKFISDLEEEMNKLPQIQIEIKTVHHFSKGVYAREITIPKGALLVGKIHKHENLNICSAGEASVLSIDGAAKVTAPFTTVSSPGVKRVIYAHEETVWTTIHGTDETDLEKIEDEFIAKNYDEVAQIEVTEVQKIEEGVCRG